MYRLSIKEETESEKDKLEIYLNDVYTKECEYKIGEDEVKFIQTGIETLVQSIVDTALKSFKDPHSSNSLYETIEAYGDKTCPSDVIKVGSFYEGTKNNFPDEFDFIFLLYSTQSMVHFGENNLSIPDYSNKLQTPLTTAILGLSNITEKIKDSLQYATLDKSRKLYFDKYMYAKGPSAKLRFVYEKDSHLKKNILVDLVPAVRQYGDTLERTVNIICGLKEFRKEILSIGSYLYINSFFANYTFTETEVSFMKNVLSQNHVKVYRILKYLINGHGDDEALKNHLYEAHSGLKTFKLYSSYRIKTIMIYHHYQCTNMDGTCLGPCILKLLNDMSKYSDIDSFPKLVDKIDAFKTNRIDVHNPQAKQFFFTMEFGNESDMPLLPYLQSIIDHLISMQTSEDSYDYERDKITNSVTGLYLKKQCL